MQTDRAALRRRLARQPAPVSSVVVRRIWPGSTVVCVGTGPSLTQADVDFCYGRARVIAVNDAYRLAPWADALYACDSKWWHWHKGAPAFPGQKYSIDPRVGRHFPAITVLRNTGTSGLDPDPGGLRTGHNSGYQAINLAVHFGASAIVLLGYDMRRQGTHYHFFGEHPDRVPPPFRVMLPAFETLVAPLAALGITVTNATRSTALDCFGKKSLEAALSGARTEESVA